MKPQYVEVVQKWVEQRHGSVLFVDLENVPEEIAKRVITVNKDNALDVAFLVSRSASVYVYDPFKYLDAAIRDKMLCL